MANKKYYEISMFWTVGIPVVLATLGYYAYNEAGFLGSHTRRILGPIFDPIIAFFGRLF